MTSQLDLDQGGTFRTFDRIWMGPSIGWVYGYAAILRVTAGGTTVAQLGNSVIAVNVNANVTIQLPQYKGSVNAGAIGLPNQFVPTVVTIIDVGGNAAAHNITILPGAGETIVGLTTYPITNNYGAVVLQPDPINGGTVVVA